MSTANRRSSRRVPRRPGRSASASPPGSGTAIAARLSDEIVAGKLLPGAHLNELAIAQRFRVSRTPVREAIRQLTSAGLVTAEPRRGAFVARIELPRLLQLFEVMAEIEALCARLSARRMTIEEKTRLRLTHERYARLVSQRNPLPYFEASNEFHRQVFAGTHNDELATLANQLFARLLPYRRRQMLASGRPEKSFAEHTAVLDAIRAGDELEAERRFRAHTGMVGENALEIMSALESR